MFMMVKKSAAYCKFSHLNLFFPIGSSHWCMCTVVQIQQHIEIEMEYCTGFIWEATIKLYLGTSSTYFTDKYTVCCLILFRLLGWVFLMGEAAALNCMIIYIACLHVGQMQIISIYCFYKMLKDFSFVTLLNCLFSVWLLWVLTSQCGNSQPGGTGLPLFQLQQAVQSLR